MRKPNLFIVGAPKCGTTALARYLGDHPEIFITRHKEPQYFVRHVYAGHGPLGPPDHLVSMAAYLNLYENAGREHTAVGEATTIYLQSKRALTSIRDFNPDAKIIVMLRDPVELARSWHLQQVWEGEEVELDFATAWRLQGPRSEGRALDHGPLRPVLLQYGRVASIGSQLETLFELYPFEQVKIILLADMATDPAMVYRDTLRFLSVANDGRSKFPVVNPSRTFRSRRLLRALSDPPRYVMSPYELLKRTMGLEAKRLGLREWIRGRLGTRPPAISSSLRAEMYEYFEPEVRKVETILKRSLPAWRGLAGSTS